MMTAAYLRTRSPRPLANKARTIAQSHPYAVAAAATAGALAISALVNPAWPGMLRTTIRPLVRSWR
jgi:hypothetical protein